MTSDGHRNKNSDKDSDKNSDKSRGSRDNPSTIII